ncbi:MAG TPA: DUF2628 domain-containing protein [Bradyrhizobium sp.]|jgi:hypothetical protein|nr:DUF2628 domain-containing protein [Bradyrhizobium sp.]
MPVYTVHAPLTDGTEARSAVDSFVFVRDGFHFWAFLLGPLWLAWHRVWLALLGYIAMMVGVAVALSRLHAGAGPRFTVLLLIALLMGFEAASLWRWTLSRRKWRQLDVVVADDAETAERRFFDRWTSRRCNVGNDQPAIDRGAPPPTRDIPGQAFSRSPSSPHSDIIGLFPQPGASR